MDKLGEYYINCMTGSPDDNHRLLVLLEAVGEEGKAYNFHSLLLQQLNNEVWVDLHSISRESFQAAYPNRRWVNEVHSFDPATGKAIIRVAEGDVPEGSKKVSYSYSWREWDLNGNKEIAFIKKCEDPWEPYEGDGGGS